MEGEEEGERLMEEVAVVDFDMLCAAVALQTQGVKVERRLAKEEEEGHGDAELGGVQRMWEGGVLGCLEDRRIAMEAACCPCCRFGSNMGRAGLGPCFLQGSVYLSLLALALLNLTAFGITEQHYFMYLGVAFAISVGLYAGYFRVRIRKLFNIRFVGRKCPQSICFIRYQLRTLPFPSRLLDCSSCCHQALAPPFNLHQGSGNSLEDCIFHLLCPCCTLCQESRTLEMNNVQDGIWHGRGDTICIGKYGEGSKEFNVLHKPSLILKKNPESCNMERTANGSGNHSWIVDISPSKPLVVLPIIQDESS